MSKGNVRRLHRPQQKQAPQGPTIEQQLAQVNRLLVVLIRREGRIRVTPEEMQAIDGKPFAIQGHTDASGAMLVEAVELDDNGQPVTQIVRGVQTPGVPLRTR